MSVKICDIPNIMACLPEGTRLIPACSVYPDRDGWVILPPEKSMESEEAFQEWKDQMYSNAIDFGLRGSVGEPCSQDHHELVDQLSCSYCPQCGTKL